MKIEGWAGFGVIMLMIGALVFDGIALFTHSGSNQTITFNVVGINNSADAGTLVQLHLECIQFCVKYEQYPQGCWGQCATLGNEGK